jgi:NAD(P)-dependent dehydrogenase (short-subunit alcohol dehydrogenase family)
MQPARAVLVTGASSGIGEAIALHLDASGFRVYAGLRRREDGYQLTHKAPRIRPIVLDVTDAGQIADAAARVEEQLHGEGLYGLVNNAGVATVGPLEFLPLETLRRQFEVNVFGQVAVTQAFLPLLRKGQGRVINMGSINGRVPLPFFGPYAATKKALAAITDALRLELAPWNIAVTLIEPGNTGTPIVSKTLESAHRLRRQLPARAEVLYGPAMDAVESAAVKLNGHAAPTTGVARVVLSALRARKPRDRYVVGWDARLAALVTSLLPHRLLQMLIARYFQPDNAAYVSRQHHGALPTPTP